MDKSRQINEVYMIEIVINSENKEYKQFIYRESLSH